MIARYRVAVVLCGVFAAVVIALAPQFGSRRHAHGVAPYVVQLGNVVKGSDRLCTLAFINESADDIEVVGFRPSCSCTTLSSVPPTSIAPNARVEIPLKIRFEKPFGSFQTSATLVLKDFAEVSFIFQATIVSSEDGGGR